MGVMHAIYGVGAMCAPLVSTQFAQLRRWSFGYLVHVGLVLINAVFQAFTFKFKSEAGASHHLDIYRRTCMLANYTIAWS